MEPMKKCERGARERESGEEGRRKKEEVMNGIIILRCGRSGDRWRGEAQGGSRRRIGTRGNGRVGGRGPDGGACERWGCPASICRSNRSSTSPPAS